MKNKQKSKIIIDFRKTLLFFIVFALIFQMPLLSTSSKEIKQPRTAVLIILDFTSISELPEINGSKFLFNEFDGALVSVRSGAPLKTVSTNSIYATINSGDRVFVLESPSTQVFKKNELLDENSLVAEEYFLILRGYKPKCSVILPEFEFLKSSADEKKRESIGLLGDRLKNSGVLRYVFGNGDVDDRNLYRNYSIILVDSRGEIGEGDVSRETLVRNCSLPAGYSANYKSLERKTKEILENLKKDRKQGIILLYPGDVRRLEYFKNKMPESRYVELKKSILAEYMSLVRSLSKFSDKNTLICVLCVSPTEEELIDGSNTGFIFMKGWKYKGGKLLYSKTTRHEGTIFITDLTSTIVQYFGLNKRGILGNEIIPGKSKLDIVFLETMSKKFLNTDLVRAPLISALVFLIVLTVVFVVISLVAPYSSELLSISKLLIYLSSMVPIAYLIFGYILSVDYIIGFILVFFSPVLLSLYFFRRNYAPTRVTTFSLLLMTILILIDGPISFLQRFSVLGYSFNTGARFYGIGNESMGILASGVFLIMSLLGSRVFNNVGSFSKNYQKKDAKLPWVYGMLIALFFAIYMLYPSAGANVGGSITILVGSIIGFYHAMTKKVSFKTFIYLVAGLVFMACLFLLITYMFPTFHLSKFVKSLLDNNFNTAFSILSRKIALNLKLLKFTVWNKFLLAILIALPIVLANPNDVLRKFFKKDAWVESFLFGSAFGAVSAFIFNDSGVVAAATLLIYPALIFMSELIQLRSDKEI